MTTAAQTKAKSVEELKKTFMLVLKPGEENSRLLDVKNVSGTYAKTKITTKNSETFEIAYDVPLKKGSLISTARTSDRVTFTDRGGEKYEAQSPGGLLLVSLVQAGDFLAHECHLENVRLKNPKGETLLINGAFFAFLPGHSVAKKA